MARYTGEEETAVKGEFYRNIYRKDLEEVKRLLERIGKYEGSGRAVEEGKTLFYHELGGYPARLPR